LFDGINHWMTKNGFQGHLAAGSLLIQHGAKKWPPGGKFLAGIIY
jgi:hypothetical protein